MVVNLKKLKDLVIKDNEHIESMKKIIIPKTTGSEIFLVIDLREAFYIIGIDEKAAYNTAFENKGEFYVFLSMPMSFKNSTMITKQILTTIFADLLNNGVNHDYDDIVIYLTENRTHDALVIEVLQRLSENGFKINLRKMQFSLQKSSYWNQNQWMCIEPLDDRKDWIKQFQQPTRIKDVRKFLGVCSF